jgi:hypothetical protein
MGKQEFMAVKCCQCSAFQVQQVKQSNKFTCSLCGQKQSVQRMYARSNMARDIREVVQAYNSARSDADAEADQAVLAGPSDWQAGEEAQVGPHQAAGPGRAESKWASFAEVRHAGRLFPTLDVCISSAA